MRTRSQWLKHNEEYLAAAISWLRLKLLHHIDCMHETGDASGGESRYRHRRGESSSRTLLTELQQAEAEMAAAADVTPKPALLILEEVFDLSSFERCVLLMCIASELDTQIPSLCARAQDDTNRPYPTFALVLSVFDDPVWDVVSAEHSLRYWELIQVSPIVNQPLTTSPIKADERILNYIKGLNNTDERLKSYLVPLDVADRKVNLPPSQAAVVNSIVTSLNSHPPGLSILQLVGSDSVSKQLVAQQASAKLGLFLQRLPAELLPKQSTELDTLAKLWQRESQLLPFVLYLDAHHAIDTNLGNTLSPLFQLLIRSNVLCFLSLREVQQRVRAKSLVLDVDKPTPAEQRELWESLVSHSIPDSPSLLAEQFNLNVTTIQRIAGKQQTSNYGTDEMPSPEQLHQQIWSDCLQCTRPQLDKLAHRIDPKATWSDIVMPDEETFLLHQITDQVRQRHTVYEDWGFQRRMNRGLGISTLFAGESGTGKTMAAEVIANDLNLNLYRIDLSGVVSKYIGETEKNLRSLFDAAEDGGTILFFDEADALFGKRSEVKDSHDRYANIEINYLLQRIEAYRGLAILATNLKQSLDSAFIRRLRFIVNFKFPSASERLLIWEKAFPTESPLDSIDYKRLSRFNLAGGNIHNIAVNAAFMAAQSQSPITMPLILSAIRMELRKLDRPINESDFRM